MLLRNQYVKFGTPTNPISDILKNVISNKHHKVTNIMYG